MMHHQFWVTKKSVLRKLGSKEDECIIASDAELDAKLELFRSITDSCLQLQKIIEIYLEHVCVTAKEENILGRYLKECGKTERNANIGKAITAAGKAITYVSHQRLTIRPPLVRLHHEVETFRMRAITDTRATIALMEKSRTEYRAALEWIKFASQNLDPETNGLVNFRKAQAQVRASKATFDKLKLACLEKIDLLAAARCNMFSHALVLYENALVHFSTKAENTLSINLTKVKSTPKIEDISGENITTESKDDKTFFNADYKDNPKETQNDKKDQSDANADLLIDIPKETIDPDSSSKQNNILNTETNFNQKIVEIGDSKDFTESTKQETKVDNENTVNKPINAFDWLQLDANTTEKQINSFNWLKIQQNDDFTKINSDKPLISDADKTSIDFKAEFESIFSLNDPISSEGLTAGSFMPSQLLSGSTKTDLLNDQQSKSKTASWFELFSELDPLSSSDKRTKTSNSYASA